MLAIGFVAVLWLGFMIGRDAARAEADSDRERSEVWRRATWVAEVEASKRRRRKFEASQRGER
jgi:hypothetical protein